MIVRYQHRGILVVSSRHVGRTLLQGWSNGDGVTLYDVTLSLSWYLVTGSWCDSSSEASEIDNEIEMDLTLSCWRHRYHNTSLCVLFLFSACSLSLSENSHSWVTCLKNKSPLDTLCGHGFCPRILQSVYLSAN